jgi:hypothetical protein
VNVRLSVNLIGADGRFWKAGEELPEEIVPERAVRYILGPTGSSADPEDVAGPPLARERPRAAREKARG